MQIKHVFSCELCQENTLVDLLCPWLRKQKASLTSAFEKFKQKS